MFGTINDPKYLVTNGAVQPLLGLTTTNNQATRRAARRAVEMVYTGSKSQPPREMPSPARRVAGLKPRNGAYEPGDKAKPEATPLRGMASTVEWGADAGAPVGGSVAAEDSDEQGDEDTLVAWRRPNAESAV